MTLAYQILDVFTDRPFAGNPTIGAAFALARAGMIPMEGETGACRLELDAGTASVTIEIDDGGPGLIRIALP